MNAYPHSAVFPKALGFRFSDFTAEERQRMVDVFCAAMSEAGWPVTPEPHPTRGDIHIHLLHAGNPPTELVEKARALALMSVGRAEVSS